MPSILVTNYEPLTRFILRIEDIGSDFMYDRESLVLSFQITTFYDSSLERYCYCELLWSIAKNVNMLWTIDSSIYVYAKFVGVFFFACDLENRTFFSLAI